MCLSMNHWGTEKGRLTSGTERKSAPPQETTRKRPTQKSNPKSTRWFSTSKSCINTLDAAACCATASWFRSIHVHFSMGMSRSTGWRGMDSPRSSTTPDPRTQSPARLRVTEERLRLLRKLLTALDGSTNMVDTIEGMCGT